MRIFFTKTKVKKPNINQILTYKLECVKKTTVFFTHITALFELQPIFQKQEQNHLVIFNSLLQEKSLKNE